MPKKQWTDEERAAFAAKMKAARNKTVEIKEDTQEHIQNEQGLNELRAQMKEVLETNALLKAALLGKQTNSSVGIGAGGQLLGEVDKYLVDPDNYPDPTPRLGAEQRLQSIAFPYNYELEYSVSVSSYETKTGINMREPKFLIQLNRIRLDDQGMPTNKRYIARRMVFHEDPQAALVIARENGLTVDRSDEKTFLNEMRYLRIRDWLFDIFWPRPATSQEGIREESIGGTLVQVFTKSSEDPSEIEFDKIKSKMV